MKVLITGENSYVGKNIGNFLLYKNMEVKYVSVRNGISEDEFTGVDTVVHCAAIVHKRRLSLLLFMIKSIMNLLWILPKRRRKKALNSLYL